MKKKKIVKKKPIEMKKEKFTLQVNYSDNAIKNKLMKFITPFFSLRIF